MTDYNDLTLFMFCVSLHSKIWYSCCGHLQHLPLFSYGFCPQGLLRSHSLACAFVGAGVGGLAEHERNKHSGSGTGTGTGGNYGSGSGDGAALSGGTRGVGATGTGSNYDTGSNQGAALTTGNVRSHLPGSEDTRGKPEQHYGQGVGGGSLNSGSGISGSNTGTGSGANDTTTGAGSGGAAAKLKAHLPGTKEYKVAHGKGDTGTGTGSGSDSGYGSNTGNTGSGSHTGRDAVAG